MKNQSISEEGKLNVFGSSYGRPSLLGILGLPPIDSTHGRPSLLGRPPIEAQDRSTSSIELRCEGPSDQTNRSAGNLRTEQVRKEFRGQNSGVPDSPAIELPPDLEHGSQQIHQNPWNQPLSPSLSIAPSTNQDFSSRRTNGNMGASIRSYVPPGKRGPQYSMSQKPNEKVENRPTTILFDMPQSEMNEDMGSEINHWTLSFNNPRVEREYASFFATKAMKMWRIGLIIGLAVSLILFMYNGLFGDTPIIDETLLLAFTAVFPIVTLLCSSYLLVLRQKQTAKFAHIASTLGVVLMGGAAISIRHYLIETHESSYKTGLFYILLLMGAHVMLRIRFFFLAVSMPLLLCSYIIEQVASMRATSMDHIEDIFISTICLTAAMCIIASSSYATENATRKDFLISRVSKKTTTKLVEQLKRLQKTYTHQVADFDSPLEKSIILVKSILADPSLQHQHINSLSKLLALLKSGDLMTPDIQKQVEGGLVDLDKEQEVNNQINVLGVVI
jgi:hypothetical protein